MMKRKNGGEVGAFIEKSQIDDGTKEKSVGSSHLRMNSR